MRKENTFNNPAAEDAHTGTLAAESAGSINPQSAFEYLKSLPPNYDRPVLESYKRNRESQVIDYQIAEDFTGKFRSTEEPFNIPVSWTLTKSALLKLLGIISYEGHEAVNGVRFYAGVNDDKQLTLVAVSTMAGTGCNDDLTIHESYPYYDYADPCPENCSNRGNLRAENAVQLKVQVVQ